MTRSTLRTSEIEDRIRETAWSVARSSFTSLRGQLHQVHLSPPQYWVLQMLEDAPRLSTGEISERLAVRLPTVTGFLDLLVKQGYVVRSPSASDRRKVLVRLTPRGASTLKLVRSGLRADWHTNLEALPQARKRAILLALTELESHIEREPTRRELCRPSKSRGRAT